MQSWGKSLRLNHIVAMSENRVIGRAGGLPWHIPADFKFFKSTTLGHPMVMGRKTYESIGRPLPGRLNIVISRSKSYAPEGVIVVSSLEAALDYCKQRQAELGDDIFIIGGGEIFNASMHLMDRLYLTVVHQDVEGDVYYPKFDAHAFTVKELGGGEDPLPFSWYLFERR